jgi:Streptomyces sporulation and cell division protein, SsgA.
MTVEAVLDGGHHSAGRRAVRLRWSSGDPLAVRVDVVGTRAGPWVVLRDVLREGLTQPTGIGQVRVGPVGRHVTLTLQSAGRLLVTRVAAERLRAFLDQTETVVAAGTEACDESLDATLDALFHQS